MYLQEIINEDGPFEVAVDSDGSIWIASQEDWLMRMDTSHGDEFELQLAKEVCQVLNQRKGKRLNLGAEHKGFPLVVNE